MFVNFAGLSRLSPSLTGLLCMVHAFTRTLLWGRAFLRGCGHPFVVTRSFDRSAVGEIHNFVVKLGFGFLEIFL